MICSFLIVPFRKIAFSDEILLLLDIIILFYICMTRLAMYINIYEKKKFLHRKQTYQVIFSLTVMQKVLLSFIFL